MGAITGLISLLLVSVLGFSTNTHLELRSLPFPMCVKNGFPGNIFLDAKGQMKDVLEEFFSLPCQCYTYTIQS